jgi:hypothetical protein
MIAASAAGCGGSLPILPASVPLEGWVPYDDGVGRSLLGPRGGALVPSADDVDLRYEDGASVTVSAVSANGMPISTGSVASALHAIRGLGGATLEKEEAGGASITCAEKPDGELAACARLDDTLRAQAETLLAVFHAPAAAYKARGGARFVAEVLKSAKGFRARGLLPAP